MLRVGIPMHVLQEFQRSNSDSSTKEVSCLQSLEIDKGGLKGSPSVVNGQLDLTNEIFYADKLLYGPGTSLIERDLEIRGLVRDTFNEVAHESDYASLPIFLDIKGECVPELNGTAVLNKYNDRAAQDNKHVIKIFEWFKKHLRVAGSVSEVSEKYVNLASADDSSMRHWVGVMKTQQLERKTKVLGTTASILLEHQVQIPWDLILKVKMNSLLGQVATRMARAAAPN
ncbi:MAG: hypothetical protein Q9215_004712 [Flavoplaca cf. flavocitrina]